MKLLIFDIEKKEEPRGFGINGRYSLRIRIPPLRKELGERAIYRYTKDGPELIAVEKVTDPCAGFNYILNEAKNQIKSKIKNKKNLNKIREEILEENSSDCSPVENKDGYI